MARVTVEDCLKLVDSRFALVHLAVRRVLQLRSGGQPQAEAPRNKEVVMALREIAAGRVTEENIRGLEEMKILAAPPAAAVAREPEEATKAEVLEILEEAAQFNAAIEFDSVEPFENEDGSEDVSKNEED
jgi:DNA-directed RNA polymerase subunit omega